jgi:serine protease Do
MMGLGLAVLLALPAAAGVPLTQVSTPTFSRVFEAVSPSIVSVTAKRRTWSTVPASGGESHDGGAGGGGQEAQLLPPGPSLGSGVIVSSDGYVLTNSHVLEGADEVKVALSSGTETLARVIGRDAKTDIAVVKVDLRGLTAATFGDSSKTAIGDVVLALGYPFGIGQTVTMGIVSATSRGNIGLEDYEDFLQTDAAINPGNSGGALVNAAGEVIGINTAILSRTGGNQGIGFAVPSNIARMVASSLIASGRVARGYLGLTVQDLTPALAKQFSAQASGALVADTVRRGPAARAGLRPGDVITAFDGHPVRDGRALRLQAGQTPPGRSVEISYTRAGSPRRASVVLREQSAAEAVAAAPPPSKPFAGALLQDLTPEARGKLDIGGEVRGALVAAIERGSPAHDSGLRPGDVIIEVAGRSVASVGELWRVATSIKRPSLLLRVWQSGASRYLVLEAP